MLGLCLAACSVGGATSQEASGQDAAPTTVYPGAATSGGHRDQLVSRTGASLSLGGKPFRFVGFNLYDAASSPAYTCVSWPRYTDAELDSAFGYLHDEAGVDVIRFWAYQTYTAGGTDFSGVDRVLAAARRYDMKVLPVLEDGPGDCTTGPRRTAKWAYQGDTWYSKGYRVPYGTATLSYRDYVRVLTAHYRGNPTILGWSMMNEAETSQRDATGRSQLVDFATDIAAVIKRADPTHLLTVGTQSNGAPGASGPDFAAVYSVPGVDFAEVHDYADRGSDVEGLPGGPDGGTRLPAPGSPLCRGRAAPVSCSMVVATQVLHEPFIVGEAGIDASGAAGRRRRSELFGVKMRAAFRVGASGYLVWQFNKVHDTDYDVLATDGDPLIAVMRGMAAGAAD